MSVHLEVVRHDALSEFELAAIVQLCTQAFGEPFDEIIRLHTGGAHVWERSTVCWSAMRVGFRDCCNRMACRCSRPLTWKRWRPILPTRSAALVQPSCGAWPKKSRVLS